MPDIQIYELPAKSSLEVTDMLAVDDNTVSHETSKVTGQKILDLVSSDGNSASTTTVAVTNDVSTNLPMYPLWVDANSGNKAAKVSSSKLSFNPSSGTLTATIFNGALVGTAVNANNGQTLSTTTDASYYPLFVANTANSFQPFRLNSGLNYNPSASQLTISGSVNIGTPQAKEGISILTLFGQDSSASGPHFEVYTAADNYPVVQHFNYAHNNTSINFDCYYDSDLVLRSSYAGSNFQIYKKSDQLQFLYDGGDAPGDDISGFILIAMYLDTTGNLNLNNNLNVNNNINVNNNLVVVENTSLGPTITMESPCRLNLTGIAGDTDPGSSLAAYSSADPYPIVHHFNFSHDNVAINFDCYFNDIGDQLSSYAGSNFCIYKFSDQLNFCYNSGIAPGDSMLTSRLVAMYIDTAGNVNCNNFLIATNGIVTSGYLTCDTPGLTLKVAQGSNACAGVGEVMVGGTVTVNTDAVNTGDIVLLMKTANGGTSTVGMPVVTIIDSTSFTITGDVTDTSTWSWFIVKAT